MSAKPTKIDLKIHPPYIAGTAVAIAYLMNKISMFNALDFSVGFAPTIILFVAGSLFDLIGLIYFFKHKTTFDPTNPQKSTQLVTTGVYKISRNPMYLGLLLIILGCVFLFGNGASFLGPLFFVWYITKFQIKPEERILNQKFGSVYQNYVNNTRRWL